jgi:hypothetical protein
MSVVFQCNFHKLLQAQHWRLRNSSFEPDYRLIGSDARKVAVDIEKRREKKKKELASGTTVVFAI